jgi:cytochrome c peroxidase
MGANPDVIAGKLNRMPGYSKRFQAVFGGPATPERVTQAIASYERTIFCADTRFDRAQGGDADAMTAQEQRGYELFRGKASCTSCHVGGLLTDTLYHNVGIGMSSATPDVGRRKVTGDEKETGAFKTPTLRDITRSGPYFHDGSVKSLREAVKLMAGGGIENEWLDRENLKDRQLTEAELDDLVAFLGALECKGKLEAPRLP